MGGCSDGSVRVIGGLEVVQLHMASKMRTTALRALVMIRPRFMPYKSV